MMDVMDVVTVDVMDVVTVDVMEVYRQVSGYISNLMLLLLVVAQIPMLPTFRQLERVLIQLSMMKIMPLLMLFAILI